jgi:hypothetical protein
MTSIHIRRLVAEVETERTVVGDDLAAAMAAAAEAMAEDAAAWPASDDGDYPAYDLTVVVSP